MLQKKSNGNEAAKYIRIAVLLIYDILAVFLAEIISYFGQDLNSAFEK